jgi:hypothetical protein
MKKILLPLAALLLLALATPAFAEWDLGVSWLPLGKDVAVAKSEYNFIPGFHVGYGFWYIGYATWDAYAMPNWMIWNITNYYFAPGFLNLWDVGLRLQLGPVVGFGEIGINNVYVYQTGLVGADGIGANIRLGAGLKFDWWGITMTGTNVYGSFNEAASNIGGLFSGDANVRTASVNRITNGLLWDVGVTFYFR